MNDGSNGRDLADIAVQPEQGAHLKSVAVIAVLWSLFQLWYASPLPFWLGFGILNGVQARSMHLGFAVVLVFLLYRSSRSTRQENPTWLDYALLALGGFCTFYIAVMYEQLALRAGQPLAVWQITDNFGIPFEFLVGLFGIAVLLEATRRSISLPLVIICLLFFVYSIFGQYMPRLISHRGVTPERLIGYHWFDGEAIFGVALDVSVSVIFLFVLFAALLERAGAGQYFLNLAFSLVGRMRGGPAKASILASGMTGMISGSSVANTVTTGNFTIPIMMRTGMPATKAGAIEVAASVNGQIMPPIMGAAAFVMAEFIGISYFDVIYHAFLPAVIAYLALLYISHLEALKLNLQPMPEEDIPPAGPTFRSGIHYLIPIAVLVYLLLVERMTPRSAVFYSILVLIGIIFLQHLMRPGDRTETTWARLKDGLIDVTDGLVAGARNMANVAVAIGAAGIVIGAVSSTGLNNALVGVVEAVSGGNIAILLVMTAVLCLLLGLGLPTTANYLVVASILAPVVVEVGTASGLFVPLIVVHLFVFYFGLMADVTPPVGLAAYAASAISRADPIKTGTQAFYYEIRTGILPFIFVFNTELVLIGVDNVVEGVFVFFASLLAMFAFASLTQRWMFTKVNWVEMAGLVVAMALLFRPAFFLNQVYPEFTTLELTQAALAPTDLEERQSVRVRIERQTEYGDRRRVALFTPEELKGSLSADALGFDIGPADGGGAVITDTKFLGLGEEKGLEIGDRVIEIGISNPDRPGKYWFSVIGLFALAGVGASQWRRRDERPVTA